MSFFRLAITIWSLSCSIENTPKNPSKASVCSQMPCLSVFRLKEQIMREFKSGRINILIATDIVSRGIDIDDIRLVINYDVPHDSEDYVHRIGRTARANHDGCAITFVSEKEQTQFKAIENFLGRNIYKIPVPEELGEAPEYNPRSGAGRSNHKGGSSRKQGNYKGKKNGTPSANNRRNTPKE